MCSVSKIYMFLYLDKEMFYWIVSNDCGWKLSREATDAVYDEYFNGMQCYLDEIIDQFGTAIEMSVSEIFKKCKNDFDSEDDVLGYLETESSITIDNTDYEIEYSFENTNNETIFILK